MSDEKIFKDLEGILKWVKMQLNDPKFNKNGGAEAFNKMSQKEKNERYLKQFLKFLNFDIDSTAKPEEFMALIEVLGNSFEKRDLEFTGQFLALDSLVFLDLYQIFVPDNNVKKQ